ncbi:hypothetical protein PR048_025461 [Dryococelus australis]|uniref:Uncharacterized protein n=1 Tax=Dryococelus australis TaxID=614101 RepID=A0ABQ9GRE2_9NEOP|nr:hypothetical protein PR048_025461 [Dryococelus australis]
MELLTTAEGVGWSGFPPVALEGFECPAGGWGVGGGLTRKRYGRAVMGHVVRENKHACKGEVSSPPTKAIRVQYPAGSLRIFACGNRAGRHRWSAGFLGDVLFPPALLFQRCSILASITLIATQELDVTSQLSSLTQIRRGASPFPGGGETIFPLQSGGHCARPMREVSTEQRRNERAEETVAQASLLLVVRYGASCTGKRNWEGIGHGLCYGPIPVFVWSDFGKPWKTLIRMARPRIEPGSSVERVHPPYDLPWLMVGRGNTMHRALCPPISARCLVSCARILIQGHVPPHISRPPRPHSFHPPETLRVTREISLDYFGAWGRPPVARSVDASPVCDVGGSGLESRARHGCQSTPDQDKTFSFGIRSSALVERSRAMHWARKMLSHAGNCRQLPRALLMLASPDPAKPRLFQSRRYMSRSYSVGVDQPAKVVTSPVSVMSPHVSV